jgi:hypothetical protein
MGTFTFELSLRIEHPSADLTIVGDSLGMRPIRIWKAGEKRTTPDGKPLAGTYKDSYCTIRFEPIVTNSLPDQIRETVNIIRTHRDLFEQLAASGGAFNLFIGWFSEGNSGEHLDWKLLKDLADLRVSLDLDIYGGHWKTGSRVTHGTPLP